MQILNHRDPAGSVTSLGDCDRAAVVTWPDRGLRAEWIWSGILERRRLRRWIVLDEEPVCTRVPTTWARAGRTSKGAPTQKL
jgi:hypothetical protein